MRLRVAGITNESVVDGPGIRLVLFVQGCPHNCADCQNPETHDPNGGRLMATEEIIELLDRGKLLRGITFSGGEPFGQPAALAQIAEVVKEKGMDVVTYTGFLFEDLLHKAKTDVAVKALLTNTDLLIDGRYKKDERDLRLAFRGSRNQRLINVPQSLVLEKAVVWEDPYFK